MDINATLQDVFNRSLTAFHIKHLANKPGSPVTDTPNDAITMGTNQTPLGDSKSTDATNKATGNTTGDKTVTTPPPTALPPQSYDAGVTAGKAGTTQPAGNNDTPTATSGPFIGIAWKQTPATNVQVLDTVPSTPSPVTKSKLTGASNSIAQPTDLPKTPFKPIF